MTEEKTVLLKRDRVLGYSAYSVERQELEIDVCKYKGKGQTGFPYLLSMSDEKQYYGHVSMYANLKDLEMLAKNIQRFVDKEREEE